MSAASLFLPALLFATTAHAQLPSKPAPLALCAPCHGETGIAIAIGIPYKAGQDCDADIDALADRYAAQSRPTRAAR